MLGSSPSAAELPLGAIVGQVSELVGSMGGFSPTRALSQWTSDRMVREHAAWSGSKSTQELIKAQIAAERRGWQPQNQLNRMPSHLFESYPSPYRGPDVPQKGSSPFRFALTRRESPKNRQLQHSPSRAALSAELTELQQAPHSLRRATSPSPSTKDLQQYFPSRASAPLVKSSPRAINTGTPLRGTVNTTMKLTQSPHERGLGTGSQIPQQSAPVLSPRSLFKNFRTAPEGSSQFLLEETLRDLSRALEERKHQLVNVQDAVDFVQRQHAGELSNLRHALKRAATGAEAARGSAARDRRVEDEEHRAALEVLQRQLASERAALLSQHESEAARLQDHHVNAMSELRQRLVDLTAQQAELEERQRGAAKAHVSAVRDLRNQAQSREEVHAAQARELQRSLHNEETIAATSVASADASRATLLALQAQVESVCAVSDFAGQARFISSEAASRRYIDHQSNPMVLGAAV